MAELGRELGDRLIAAKQPRRPGLLPAAAGGLLLLALILVSARRQRGPALVERTVQSAVAFERAAPAAHPAPRLNPSSAEARQQRGLFETPLPSASACGYAGGALPRLSAELVTAHSRRGVLFGTLATAGMAEMVVNFVGHLAPLVGECAVLVGFMDASPALQGLAARLRAGVGAGAYAAGEAAPAEGGQAGRWRHARGLLAACAAARVDLVLSDVDVVWLRDPWPYFRAALGAAAGAEGALDALISTDSTEDWAKPLPAHARLPALPAELQLEPASTCGRSLNVGLLVLRGASAGAAALLAQAAEAVAAMRPGGVDQGAINRRWKGEGRAWRAARGLGCPMLGGAAMLGVLPAPQFLSLLGYSVRRLHVRRAVEPFAVHATFLRTQEPAGKLLRLREEGLWLDPPAHYEQGRFLAYTPHVPAEALAQPIFKRGAVPLQHMALVNGQLTQLREALAVARALGRALVLPRMRCACELGFGPGHVNERCDADSAIALPYDCAADHWLLPTRWLGLRWAHRERGFLDDPRVPDAVLSSRAHARACAQNAQAGCCLSLARAGEAQLRAELGGCEARVLELGDVRGLFGGFEAAGADAWFDRELQSALSSWCCTSEPAYKRWGGLVPYTLVGANATAQARGGAGRSDMRL